MPRQLTHYLRSPWRFPWSFSVWLLHQRLNKAVSKRSLFNGRRHSLDTRTFQNRYASLAGDPAALTAHLKTRTGPGFFGLSGPGASSTFALNAASSSWGNKVLQQAQASRNHVFEYAGLGQVNLGSRIDWLQDPFAGEAAPTPEPSPDLRATWELNRCHQLVSLGLGYRLTGDDAYIEELAAQMASWAEANPVGVGPNWQSAMEAALRIINWTWAFYLCRTSPRFSQQAVQEFMRQVAFHGRFIAENLERSAFSNNHYLADGIGLLHLGILFPELRASKKWLKMGWQIVTQETLVQTYPDGVGFEGSLPYHGFVLGLLLQTATLCQHNGQTLPKAVLDRLERMLEYVMAYTRPDGSYPHLGDTDSARLWPFALGAPESHCSLLAVGAALFRRADFKAASGGWTQEAHLLLGEEGRKAFAELPEESSNTYVSQGFKASGIFAMRQGDLHLLIDCADVGLRGRGGHGHNDCLSFELYAYGRTFLADSGTYRYAAPTEERNLFRGTAAHNTAMVDGQEMADLSLNDPWRIADEARPSLHLWQSNTDYDLFDGSHSGYMRLPDPVRHRRRIMFDKQHTFWVLEDRFLGKGQHRFEMLFHFTPMPVARLEEGGLAIVTANPEGGNLVILPLDIEGLRLEIRTGWVSRQYGARVEAPVACCAFDASAPATVRFCLYPYLPGKLQAPERLRRDAVRLCDVWALKAPIS